jgi:hypothetical protein
MDGCSTLVWNLIYREELAAVNAKLVLLMFMGYV